MGEKCPENLAPQCTLTVEGFVKSPCTWSLEELNTWPLENFRDDLHCVTRWSKFDVAFRGIRLANLLDQVGVLPEARFISFVSRSPRSHSSSLSLPVALEQGAFLALELEGQPLGLDHGGPLRVFIPGRYLYKSVKWLSRIELLAEDKLGFWEAMAGYHNGADPWREERYMAPQLSRLQVRAALLSRDFSDQELRSLDASGRSLPGLRACRSLLRDGRFQDCNLQQADFSAANLTNAHFERADLTGADFTDAGLEGANFCGANLTAANLEGASVFGATFCGESADGSFEQGAVIDNTTRFSEEALEQLTPIQLAYVRSLWSPRS